MDFIARNIGMLAKGLAVLIVFIVSISAPIFMAISLQEQAKDSVIKSQLDQIKNWAQIYKIKTGTYIGLSDDNETKKVIDSIYLQGGKAFIFSNANEYCVKATFNNPKRDILCIDSSGYSGNQALECNSNNSALCNIF